MNHIYRKVFNRRLGRWQVVPETARSQGKSGGRRAAALVTAALLGLAGASAAMGAPITQAKGGHGGNAADSSLGGKGGDAGMAGQSGPGSEAAVAGGAAGIAGTQDGKGGNGGNGNATRNAGGGGGGANGRSITPTVGNPTTLISNITGGNGGNGGNVTANGESAAGGGGAGGNGLFILGAGTTTVRATIRGGAGGAGGSVQSGSTASGGAGGGGGAGIVTNNAGTVSIESSASVVGGNGGAGSATGVRHGGGGGGGAGVFMTTPGTLIVQSGGTVLGGVGGGPASSTTAEGAKGGDGAGDALGYAGTGTDHRGAIGVGVLGAQEGGVNIINAGRIMGGADGALTGNAISLFGSDNRVEMRKGAEFRGNVVVAPGGGNNTLALGGTATDGFFIASDIGAGKKFQGFDQYEKTGIGTWLLAGSSTEILTMAVREGRLVVNGTLNTSPMTVHNGGTLAIANGASVGATTVLSGGTLATTSANGAGYTVGTRTIDGNLALNSGSKLDVVLGRPGTQSSPQNGTSDRFAVNGDLAFDGTVNLLQSPMSSDGKIATGYYRLITYTGNLTSNTAVIGTAPASLDRDLSELQAGNGRVDLFLTIPVLPGDNSLQHWQGGGGTWNATNEQWLNLGGNVPAAWAGNHAAFKNQPGGFNGGTVWINGLQAFKSLQFVDNGYKLDISFGTMGGLVTDASDANGSEVRVLADTTAEIAASITGAGLLRKTEGGTLILTGTHDHSGGTLVEGGFLQLGKAGVAVGSISGLVSVNQGGTLVVANSNTGGIASITNAGDTQFRGSTNAGQIVFSNTGTLSFHDNSTAKNAVISNLGTVQFAGNSNAAGATIATAPDAVTTFVGNASGGDAKFITKPNGKVDISGLSSSGMSAGSIEGEGQYILGGKTLTVGSLNTSTTVEGKISGENGGLNKVGSGTLTLSGFNTYSGATTISGGTLQVDGSIAAVTVRAGGSLTGTGMTGNTTVESGGRLAVGGGLSATNTMGRFTIGGDLNMQAGSALDFRLGSPSVGLTPGISNRLNVSGDLALDGTVNLLQSDRESDGAPGVGYYRLITYTGALTSNTATIGTKPAGNAKYALQTDDGYVNLFISPGGDGGDMQYWQGGDGVWNAGDTGWQNQDGSASSTWGGVHAIFKNRGGHAGGTIAVNGSQTFRGLQFVDGGYRLAGPGQLVTDAMAPNGSEIRVLAGAQAEIATQIAGTGSLRKTEDGMLRLTGDSSGFAGSTIVESGTLSVQGKLGGALTVATHGRLQGTGTVGNTSVSGVFAPGNSIGTINVAGNVDFQPGSVYEVEVDASGQSDLIHATGTATLNGGTVRLLAGSGAYGASTFYTILTADGGLAGTFDGVSSNLAFLTPSLGYDANNVHLTLTRNGTRYVDVAYTANQAAAGLGVERLGAGHAVHDAVLSVSAEQARTAFDHLSGEVHASLRTALIEDSRFVRDAARDRLRAAQRAPGAASASAAYSRPGSAAPIAADHGGVVFWAQGYGAWGSVNGNDNAARLRRDSQGLLLGVDGSVGGWRVGALAGYGESRLKASQRESSGSSSNVHLGAYGGTAWGDLALRVGTAYTWHDVKTRRSVAVADFSDRLKGKYDAGTWQAFGELGYGINAAGMRLEPYANLAHVRLRTERFTEQGGAAALSGQAKSDHATFTTLGLRAERQFELGAAQATLSGALGWRHAFGDMTPKAENRFQGGDAFTIAGVPIARNSAVVEAGLDIRFTPNASLGLTYAGQLASSARDHGVKANLAVRF